jgi:hypothetical protein
MNIKPSQKWRLIVEYMSGETRSPNILLVDPQALGKVVGWLEWTTGISNGDRVKDFVIIPVGEPTVNT